MKVLIHFGVQRTGTTFIQRNLAANRGTLKCHGFLYPTIEGQSHHIQLPVRLASNKITKRQILDELESQTNPTIHSIIISSENFCEQKSYRYLENIFEGYELHAIVYLRRQDLWLESWYNQHVKWPWSGTYSGSSFEYFRKNYEGYSRLNYGKLLKRIERLVPRERLYVNTLDEHGLHDSFKDFLERCEIDPDWLDVTKARHNKSLSSASIDVLRRVDINNLRPPARMKILNALINMKLKEDNGRKKFLTDRQRKKIIRKYSMSNQYVAQRYFSRDNLFSDYVPDNVRPAFVSDKVAYQEYIPELLKRMAEE